MDVQLCRILVRIQIRHDLQIPSVGLRLEIPHVGAKIRCRNHCDEKFYYSYCQNNPDVGGRKQLPIRVCAAIANVKPPQKRGASGKRPRTLEKQDCPVFIYGR